jgi:ribosomal protein L32E
MEIIETGISYHLPTDARHWIPNGFVTVDLVVNADDLAEDFYGTLEEAAEAWADANLGVGAFFQIIMEP